MKISFFAVILVDGLTLKDSFANLVNGILAKESDRITKKSK